MISTTKKSEKQTTASITVGSVKFNDAYNDFYLSRQAIRVSPRTLGFYSEKLTKFISWLDAQSLTDPADLSAKHIRQFVSTLAERSLSDWTLHGYARAIKTFVRFLYDEKYIHTPIKIDMPRIKKHRLPMLDAIEVERLLSYCSIRERAIIMFLVDTGIRISEAISLNCGDVDMKTGRVRVYNGKGGKSRIVVAGANARRALLAYQRTIEYTSSTDPLFQTITSTQFTKDGLSQVFLRLSKRSGIHFSAHALRRTFCILSLRAGMSPLVVQDLMGHADLTMTKHYAQMIDDDLIQSHKEFSPIDNLKRLK